MTVNYIHSGYPEQRNFLYLRKAKSSIRFQQETDCFKILTHLIFKIRKKINYLYLNSHFNPLSNKNRLRHFFNGISYSSSPWISTFETSLPRYHSVQWQKRGIKRLAHTSCKKIIALSKATYQIQLDFIKSHYPTYYNSIQKKIIILHPPQTIYIKNIVEKKLSNKDNIKFTFVGNQFFSKGGREIIFIFKKLSMIYPNIELFIISNFCTDNYASKTSQKDLDTLYQEIKSLPKNIHIIGSANNQEVMDLLKLSHVALLPTYAETYGYFVLEAQACGCPVISTNIRALPEINNNECGWIIEVPTDRYGNGILKTENDRNDFKKIIETGLEKTITEIMNNPKVIQLKGQKAIDRINEFHNPKKHAEQLLNIYSEALAR